LRRCSGGRRLARQRSSSAVGLAINPGRLLQALRVAPLMLQGWGWAHMQ
jgi:hypothetical protein